MSKAISFKVGQIVKNRQGWFAKIIEIKNGFIHFAGWFPKKSTADKAEKSNAFLNGFGMQRAMGTMPQIVTASEFDGTGTEEGDGDDDEEDGEDDDGEGGDDAPTDPFEGVTNADMKEALKEAGQSVGGNREELMARCVEFGIEFVEDEEA